jgi:hypothetical protein
MFVDGREARRVLARYEQLPDVDAPDGYGSVALAVLDSIFSIGIRYSTVERVIALYRGFRAAQGADAGSDGAEDLLRVMRLGDEHVADEILVNRNRTSSVNGVLKSTAVRLAAEQLAPHRVRHAQEMQELLRSPVAAELERRWRGIPGQRSGISWRYFRMLCGVEDVKPDRMILRYLQRVLDRRVSIDESVAIVEGIAEATGERLTTVDHRIWSAERSRPRDARS